MVTCSELLRTVIVDIDHVFLSFMFIMYVYHAVFLLATEHFNAMLQDC